MAGELQTSRQQIDASSKEISAANAELDQRRRHMETILKVYPPACFPDAGLHRNMN
jgi:hypothetical protein